MTVNDFNTIQTMFENEMKDKLINHMRKTVSNNIAIGNRKIKNEETRIKKIEAMEMTAERIRTILDFMFDSDILDVVAYRSEYDRLISWKERKIREIYRGWDRG